MFPERPQPSIASLLDNEHEDSKKKNGGGDGGSSGGSKSTIDYLADYGGTIGIISIGIIGALIYSYYKSIQDRNRVEDKISDAVKIEPYEIQELRYLNQLTYDQYCTLCNRVIQVHREGGSSIIIRGSSHIDSPIMCISMSYRVFIGILVDFAKSHQISFRSMHLLDRLVLAYLTTTEEDKRLKLSTTETVEATAKTTLSTNDESSSEGHVSSIYSDGNGSSKEDPVVKNSIVPLDLDPESLIPLPVLLAMLHLLLLTDDIGDRIKGLCYAASLLDDIAATEAVDSRSLVDDQEVMNIQSYTQQKQDDGSRLLSINTNSNLSFSVAVEQQQQQQQQQHLLSISRRSLEIILEALQMTDQVPPSKQVVETGVKWPIKLHRRKGPHDMVEEVS